MEILDGNKVIYKTKNFVVVATNSPFISREEGGHMMIHGNGDKYRYNSKLDFNPNEVLEEAMLCQMICEAYKIAMKSREVDIIRMNFFEAGNWAWKPNESGDVTAKAYFHEHIFGRTVDAKKQKFPDAPYLPDRSTGFYDGFKPLDDEDINAIKLEMKKLENDEKYDIEKWVQGGK